MANQDPDDHPVGHQSFHFAGRFTLSRICKDSSPLRVHHPGPPDINLNGHWLFQINPKTNGKFEVIVSEELATALKIRDLSNVNGAEFVFRPATNPDTSNADPCERPAGCAALKGAVYLAHVSEGREELRLHEVMITLYRKGEDAQGEPIFLPALTMRDIDGVSTEHFGIVH